MEDIIEDILLCLPAKSLARCKSLSKKWHHFISHNKPFRQRYLSRNTGDKHSLMLGFFFCKDGLYDDVQDQVLRFFPTSTEGRRSSRMLLMEKMKRGEEETFPLDESLSFLGHQTIYVVGCSNGFLLCSLERQHPMRYFICNPINKQWVALPKPSTTSEIVNHGFVFHATYPCLDKVHNYKVVRGVFCQNRSVIPNTLKIEILSSEFPEWKLLNLTSPFSFQLSEYSNDVWAVISEQGEVYMQARVRELRSRTSFRYARYALVIFDPRKQGLELLEYPPREDQCRGSMFGQSGRFIRYARYLPGQLIIWIVNDKDDGTKEWSLQHKVSLEISVEKFPEFARSGDYNYSFLFSFLAFHPLDPQFLFISISGKKVLCDVENSTLELVCDFEAQGWMLSYHLFPYTYDGRHLFVNC